MPKINHKLLFLNKLLEARLSTPSSLHLVQTAQQDWPMSSQVCYQLSVTSLVFF